MIIIHHANYESYIWTFTRRIPSAGRPGGLGDAAIPPTSLGYRAGSRSLADDSLVTDSFQFVSCSPLDAVLRDSKEIKLNKSCASRIKTRELWPTSHSGCVESVSPAETADETTTRVDD
jgi:hypothetical protein